MIYLQDMPLNSIVTIDSYDGGNAGGCIYGMYIKSGHQFKGFEQLLDFIEPSDDNIKKRTKKGLDLNSICKIYSKRNGRYGTFIIELYSSNEKLLRGKITWCEKKKAEFFRSGLELLKIISEVAEKSEVVSDENDI